MDELDIDNSTATILRNFLEEIDAIYEGYVFLKQDEATEILEKLIAKYSPDVVVSPREIAEADISRRTKPLTKEQVAQIVNDRRNRANTGEENLGGTYGGELREWLILIKDL